MTRAEALWSIQTVADRFEDAAHTARCLPPVRVQGHFNVWPVIVRERWERLSADEAPPPRYCPSPRDIERMLEAMRWVQWLELEQRHLVWMRADRYEWQRIARRFACCAKTAQRRWQLALQIVANELNGTVMAMTPAHHLLSHTGSKRTTPDRTEQDRTLLQASAQSQSPTKIEQY